MYGAFMAGLKAAQTAPTWPDINGSFIPASINELSPFYKNLVNNNITVQFIHRGLAYLLLVLIAAWWFKSSSIKTNKLFSFLRNAFIAVLLLQVLLGIFTLLNATHPFRLVWFGIAHQFAGMLLLITAVSLLFVVRKKQAKV